MTELAHRRWVGRLIRVGLVVVAIAILANWFWRRAPVPRDLRVQSEAQTVALLGPGDVQIYSRDSSVNLILQGDNILAGLSPKTVAKVRADIEKSSAGDDTTGLGGSIAQIVKKAVAENIGTHAVYPLSDIRDIRYEGDEIVIERQGRGDTRIFDKANVNGRPLSKSFPPDEARRFVEAVRARMNARR